MDEKFKKFDKEDDTKKTEHGNSVIDHNEVFVVTTLFMFSDDAWYVDSSAFMHLFHRKIGYVDLRKLHQLMGDNSTQEAIGKGKIKMRLLVGGNTIFATLNDVIYVPSLVKDLYYVNKATSQGYNVEFGDDNCKVRNNHKRVVTQGIQKN